MSETLFTGQPGPKGDKGDRGEGMTRGARHAVIVLFCLTLALAGANLLFTAHYVTSTVRASQKATAASQEAAAAAAAQVAACHAANTARAEQTDLWTFIIRISKPPGTARQRKVLAEFERHLSVVFAPRNCALPRPGRQETP